MDGREERQYAVVIQTIVGKAQPSKVVRNVDDLAIAMVAHMGRWYGCVGGGDGVHTHRRATPALNRLLNAGTEPHTLRTHIEA